MVAHDRDRIGNARQDALSSAGESCEEMRLDEPFCYKQGSINGSFVQNAVRSGRQDADLDVLGRIMCVMDNDLVLKLFIQSIPEFTFQFFHCCGTMESGRHEQCDIDIGASLSQFPDHVRKDIRARNRTGMVTDDDHTVRFAGSQLGKSGAADGMFHGFADDLQTILVTGQLIHTGSQHRCLIRHIQVKCCLVIKKVNCLHTFLLHRECLYAF